MAAYARDIVGFDDWAIGSTLGLQGARDLRNVHTGPLPRFRTVPRIVDYGQWVANALGYWPWSEHPDGRLPDSWATDAGTIAALKQSVGEYAGELRLCACKNLAVAIGPGGSGTAEEVDRARRRRAA